MDVLLDRIFSSSYWQDQPVWIQLFKEEQKPKQAVVQAVIVCLAVLGFLCVCLCEPFLCHLDASLGLVLLSCNCVILSKALKHGERIVLRVQHCKPLGTGV
jgi:hypothetical protein